MSDVLQVVRRHDDAFNAKDEAGRVDTLTPDTELVMPGGVHVQGTEPAMAVVRVFWEAFPDATITRDTEVPAGSVVFVEGSMTGTHTGPFRTPNGDLPPTGSRITLRYASLKRIQEGKVAAEHLYFDRLELLEQLGVVPSP